jgi:hypothetical protein
LVGRNEVCVLIFVGRSEIVSEDSGFQELGWPVDAVPELVAK